MPRDIFCFHAFSSLFHAPRFPRLNRKLPPHPPRKTSNRNKTCFFLSPLPPPPPGRVITGVFAEMDDDISSGGWFSYLSPAPLCRSSEVWTCTNLQPASQLFPCKCTSSAANHCANLNLYGFLSPFCQPGFFGGGDGGGVNKFTEKKSFDFDVFEN